MKTNVKLTQPKADDVLSIVPPLDVIRDRITRNRREAAVLRQLLKTATRKEQLFADRPREVANA